VLYGFCVFATVTFCCLDVFSWGFTVLSVVGIRFNGRRIDSPIQIALILHIVFMSVEREIVH
jgi:hypothetical protein